jgi:hypothetical protein
LNIIDKLELGGKQQMRSRSKIVAFICFWSLGLVGVFEAQAQSTTIGREFFVGFMENHRVVPDRLDLASLIISAEEDAEGIIQFVNNTIPFSIKAGDQFVYDFPQDGMDIIHRSSRAVENKGVYISSNGNIAVHAFNFRARSADGTVVLPLSSIGKDYYVTAHHEVFAPGTNPGSNVNFESTLLVVATEDNTHVEIRLSAQSVDPIPIPPGSTITVELQRGESYQVKAVGDLTGTRVRVIGSTDDDCKNVAVFGGNKMTSVGSDCENASTGDHLFQQIYPTFSWGKEYVHIPLAGRTSGEMVKVLASENNTKIFIDGQERATLNAGRFTQFSFGPNELANITSDKPIAVTTFSKSYMCNNQVGQGASDGDPTMITLSPNPQLIKSTVFSSVVVVGIVEHFVNILSLTASAGQTVLNGVNVGNQFSPVPGNPTYSYARIQVDEGSHTLTNPEGVIAYAYGSGFIESYGYSAGASLNNLNFETEVAYDFEVFGDKVACLGENGSWTILPRDPKFEIFEWSFGDDTEIKEGKTVDHLFESPGTYKVKIVAFTGTRSCDEIEEAFFEVEVLETSGKVEGPDSVCPDIDEASYFFEEAFNAQKVIWEVIGGEILEEDEYSVRVKWGQEDLEGKIIAIPVTELGCLGEVMEYDVAINEVISPGLAKGFEEICFEEGETYFYEVKDILPNRQYSWFVEGGTLLSDPTEEKVEVRWNGIGIQGQIWYEEYSTINVSCGGESDILRVNINPPLSAEVSEMTPLICLDSKNGMIQLEVTGGSGNYQFNWSHDPELNSPIAEGLGIGIYEVEVLDGGSCYLFFDQLEINEAVPLELDGNPAIVDASCYDGEDGYVSFNMKGGVPPYKVNHENALVMGSSIQVFDMARGEFEITVIDAVKCEFVFEVSIDSPDPLTAEFEMESIACPGIPSGTLTVVPDGGVGPYTVSWEHDGSTEFSLSGIPFGQYSVTVTDANGCSQVFTGEMEESPPMLRMPTGFYPPDGPYEGVSNCAIQYKLMIYNNWGQLLYVGNSGWDGMIEGADAPQGTYYYMLEYNFTVEGDNQSKQLRGVFTLVR